jgi:hypothetical protein
MLPTVAPIDLGTVWRSTLNPIFRVRVTALGPRSVEITVVHNNPDLGDYGEILSLEGFRRDFEPDPGLVLVP